MSKAQQWVSGELGFVRERDECTSPLPPAVAAASSPHTPGSCMRSGLVSSPQGGGLAAGAPQDRSLGLLTTFCTALPAFPRLQPHHGQMASPAAQVWGVIGLARLGKCFLGRDALHMGFAGLLGVVGPLCQVLRSPFALWEF